MFHVETDTYETCRQTLLERLEQQYRIRAIIVMQCLINISRMFEIEM